MRLRALRDRASELGFTPQDEVRWLAPVELWRTAVKVALSSVFADYADRREVQAALPSTVIEVPADPDGGVWVDFVADIGDGFDATFTVASLIAAPALEVGVGSAPPTLRLPRGSLLVMGGDEVYPTPSAVGYEDRTKGPYGAALAAGLAPGDEAPLLVALPGNHDWYDGLTAFLRVFAQRRSFGGWLTRQTRSYFAVRLPQRWWLVGLDTQLGTYIDDPQVRYFRQHLSARLQPGDGVIVCAPTPTWVHTGEGEPDAFNALHYFERDVVRRRLDDDGAWFDTGASVRLWITGDRHHYARYAEEVSPPASGPDDGRPRQLVTCGLGGAYLADTHRLPVELELPPSASRLGRRVGQARYGLRSRWPSSAESRRLVFGMFAGPRGLPFRNPGLWPLAGVVHAAVLVLGLLPVLGLDLGIPNPVTTLRLASPADVGRLAGQVAVWGGAAMLLSTFLPVLRGNWPRPPSDWARAVLVQVVVAFGGLTAATFIAWPETLPDWLVIGLAALGTAVVTGLVACYGLALSIATARSHLVRGWQTSAQAIEDRKGFVRIRIDPSGKLAVHPIVVDTVCHDWDVVPDREPGSLRPVPAGELPHPYLVEAPIVVDREPSPAEPGESG